MGEDEENPGSSLSEVARYPAYPVDDELTHRHLTVIVFMELQLRYCQLKSPFQDSATLNSWSISDAM